MVKYVTSSLYIIKIWLSVFTARKWQLWHIYNNFVACFSPALITLKRQRVDTLLMGVIYIFNGSQFMFMAYDSG